MQSHTSIFSLLSRNMQAYTVSWVTTFFSSMVNVVWTTYVFKYDFVSNIDGALASQIGVVLINELFLLYSVIVSRKYLFGIGAPVNILWILLTAAFICLLIYAPMVAFKTFAMLNGIEISGQGAPLYDEITGYSDSVIGLVLSSAPANLEAEYSLILQRVIGGLSAVVAFLYLRSFFKKRTA